MRNVRVAFCQVLLFASVVFALAQLTNLNHAIKRFVWGSHEGYLHHEKFAIKVQERQLQEEHSHYTNKEDNEIPQVDQNNDGKAESGSKEHDASPKSSTLKIRPTRGSVNSFISPYHKHWDVNCSEILSGNRTVVRETNMMLKKLRNDSDVLPIPTDQEVTNVYTMY